jgi:branched-chain amino acid transport system permease protein
MRLLQTFVNGLSLGSVYALLALGFVIIYKSTRVISFAQPALMVVGGLATYYFAQVMGVNFFLALGLGALATAVVGLLIERSALRPMVGKPVFVMAIITIGVDIILRVLSNRYIGVQPKAIRDPWGFDTLDLGGLVVQQRNLAIIAMTAAVVTVLGLFFKYSRMGLAMRATAFDQEASLAQGISVGTVFALSWAIAGALAALAGAFIGSASGGIDQQTWIIALKALPAIILGGLDSLPGAVVAGFVIGVVEALVATYQGQFAPWLGANFSVVSPYVVMLFVLLVRPYGLFGTPEVERV